MYNFKEGIEIVEANQLLHSYAAILDEKSKELFYGAMQYARDTDDPKKIIETIHANILMMACNIIQKAANGKEKSKTGVAEIREG
jgi:hypothetical protein